MRDIWLKLPQQVVLQAKSLIAWSQLVSQVKTLLPMYKWIFDQKDKIALSHKRNHRSFIKIWLSFLRASFLCSHHHLANKIWRNYPNNILPKHRWRYYFLPKYFCFFYKDNYFLLPKRKCFSFSQRILY